MAKFSKRYAQLRNLVNRDTYYEIGEAVKLSKQLATAKFDETLELHIRLGIDPRHSDQQVRSTVMLPHGTGKTVRVLVFAEGEEGRAAQAAGADVVADDEVIERILKEGFLDFDATLSTPSMMKKVGKVARVLGPRGLMPNPKAGTVVEAGDLERAINEVRAGRVEFRNDKTGNLHVPVGKLSFTEEQLLENAKAVIEAVESVKPSGVKGIYVRRVVLAPTMGPGVRVELSSL